MNSGGEERATDAPLDAEDRARANLYGLISRFFYESADPNLLAEIRRSGQAAARREGGGGLITAWQELQEACRSAYPAVIKQEFDSLFVGVGKSQVTPYLSAYAAPAAPDRNLVRLRGRLAAWGLARRAGAGEVEDHISGISDVLRWLVENRRPVAEQQEFFEGFAYPGVISFCAAVQKAPASNFYKHVAAFTVSFFELERAAFEMDGLASS